MLTRFLVELGVCGDLVEHHDEARLGAGLVQRVGHAVIQGIKVLAEVRGQRELGADHVEHVLLGQGLRQVGVQKVMAQGLGGFLQVVHAVGANRLHHVCTGAFEGLILNFLLLRVHLRGSLGQGSQGCVRSLITLKLV